MSSGGGRRELRSPGFQSLVGFGAFSVLKRAINDFLKQENNLKLLFFPETICSLPPVNSTNCSSSGSLKIGD